MAERLYPWETVTEAEVARFETDLRVAFDCFLPERIVASYEACGLEVLADPRSPAVSDVLLNAIKDHRPFSGIRISDGEMNLISFGRFAGMPNLDRHVAEAIVWQQRDSFRINETWIVVLRDLLMGAIAAADLVGTVGVGSGPPADPDNLIALFRRSAKGVHGQFRGRQLMPEFARSGLLNGKIISTYHLYFGVISNLDRLVDAAEKVLVVTDRTRLATTFAKRFRDKEVGFVRVGRKDERRREADFPYFLPDILADFPGDLTGTLCLVGAGPWAEIYCGWAKQRGGIAVDIGSGFDLLDGESTRPAHRLLPKQEVESFRLKPKR